MYSHICSVHTRITSARVRVRGGWCRGQSPHPHGESLTAAPGRTGACGWVALAAPAGRTSCPVQVSPGCTHRPGLGGRQGGTEQGAPRLAAGAVGAGVRLRGPECWESRGAAGAGPRRQGLCPRRGSVKQGCVLLGSGLGYVGCVGEGGPGSLQASSRPVTRVCRCWLSARLRCVWGAWLQEERPT